MKTSRNPYSIKDHLGNVRVTFADVKVPANGQLLDFYTETQSVSTYYPFGWEIKPLSWAFESFKFGFNGQEKSSEISNGNYTAKFWEYDSRIGKRWNLDPKPNTSFSPYLTFANNPVWFSDALGDTIIINLHDGVAKFRQFLGGKKNSPLDVSEVIAGFLENRNEFDGVFVISTHGARNHITDNRTGKNSQWLETPEEIMEVLNENEYWKIANEMAKKGEMQLTLIFKVCNTGTPYAGEGKTPIAQKFSEAYKYITVAAPNGDINNFLHDLNTDKDGNKIFKADISVIPSTLDIPKDLVSPKELGFNIYKAGKQIDLIQGKLRYEEKFNPDKVGKKFKSKSSDSSRTDW